MPQLDLFAQPARPPAPPRIVLPPTPPRPSDMVIPISLAAALPRRPSASWQRRLDAAGDVPLELMVSARWTGQIVEVLSLPHGRAHLWRDGIEQDGIPPAGRTYRTVFVTAPEARRIAARAPLALIGAPGTHALHLRAADARHTAWADLSDWLDGLEALEAELALEAAGRVAKGATS